MHVQNPTPRRDRAGFTLVEMLTVIVILGLLAGLITAAVGAARTRARRAIDKIDLAQLQMALEKYKQEFGEYPPDFTFINYNMSDDADPIRRQARNDLVRHIRKRWPRYDGVGLFAGNVHLSFIASLSTFGLAEAPTGPTDDPMKRRIYLDPASALAFWLGGLPEEMTELKPNGFHEDPANPFRTGRPRTAPLFDFDTRRFVWTEEDPFSTTGGVRGMRYYPASAEVPDGTPASPTDYAPYVYFKARRLPVCESRYEYGYATTTDPSNAVLHFASYTHGPADTAGTTLFNAAVPYLDEYPGNAPYWDADVDDPTDATIVDPPASDDVSTSGLRSLDYVRRWRSPEKFQVLCAGLDGQFGDITAGRHAFRFTRTRENFTENDPDNMADFSENTLEDEQQP